MMPSLSSLTARHLTKTLTRRRCSFIGGSETLLGPIVSWRRAPQLLTDENLRNSQPISASSTATFCTKTTTRTTKTTTMTRTKDFFLLDASPLRRSSSSSSSSSTSDETICTNDRDHSTGGGGSSSKFEGVSDAVSKLITHHACQPQTSVSLQTLMQTGRGEFLHKTYKDMKPRTPPPPPPSEERQDSSTSSSSSSESSEISEDNQGHDDHPPTDNRVATEKILIQVAGFLRRELPIRLAHRIQDLERVPLMKDMPAVVGVKKLYMQSFLELTEFTPKIMTPDVEQEFATLVETIYTRHSKVLVQMARGAYEVRDEIRRRQQQHGFASSSSSSTGAGGPFEQMESTHEFLDRFYLCRIGIRVLIGQYLSLRQPPIENYVGIICSKTSPYEIVKRAIDDASFMCTRKYGDAPDVVISGRLDLTFPYVPTHLHYIMLELLKNSMRATVDWHGIDAPGGFPDIKVVIADGSLNEDVVIKVSDEGGGIPRSNTTKIWSYLFTTADPSVQEGMVGGGGTLVSKNPETSDVDHGINAPLAGLGYGLPISRSYCRYFGGDLSIMSMEGYGTDAFVYLTRLGNTREPVPI